jgi:hypothetical protein
VGLIHSKPYDSPSRGKIERFFRTVRESFLTDHEKNTALDIKTLNDLFGHWVRDKYHHGHHHGIETRPVDRYQISIRNFPRRRVSEETLDEYFYGAEALCGWLKPADTCALLYAARYRQPH